MNFSTEHWPTHRQGHQKRVEILSYLRDNPNANPSQIAEAVNLCTRQVRNHLSTLKQHHQIESDGQGHFQAVGNSTYLYKEFIFFGEQSHESQRICLA